MFIPLNTICNRIVMKDEPIVKISQNFILFTKIKARQHLAY